jgi:hypothetical protein
MLSKKVLNASLVSKQELKLVMEIGQIKNDLQQQDSVSKERWFKMKNLLCKLGLHRPINIPTISSFVDVVAGTPIYIGKCSCGKTWMTEGKWFGSKVEKTVIKEAIK